jgi:hypothetical protein
MLVIHFNHICKVGWRFVMYVNYHQQTPLHLGFYSSLIKGWITEDITLRQDINIKPFLVIHALQDSKCLPWNFGWLKNGTAWNRSPSSFNQVNWRNILGFLKTKHTLPPPCMVLSNHSVYVVFLDPHQGINDFAFFLPTSKSLCGAQVGMNVKSYLHCIYCKVKTKIQEEKCHTLRSKCACMWNIYGG